MDSRNIEALLEKYWKCETSLEEETLLREYFRRPDVADHLADVASLFRHFDSARSQSITDISFDNRVLQQVTAKKAGRTVSMVRNAMRIAAGVAVLIVAGWLIRNEIWSARPENSIDDPQVAYEETKKALLLISRTFNAAEEQAKKVNLFHEAQKQLEQEENL